MIVTWQAYCSAHYSTKTCSAQGRQGFHQEIVDVKRWKQSSKVWWVVSTWPSFQKASPLAHPCAWFGRIAQDLQGHGLGWWQVCEVWPIPYTLTSNHSSTRCKLGDTTNVYDIKRHQQNFGNRFLYMPRASVNTPIYACVHDTKIFNNLHRHIYIHTVYYTHLPHTSPNAYTCAHTHIHMIACTYIAVFPQRLSAGKSVRFWTRVFGTFRMLSAISIIICAWPFFCAANVNLISSRKCKSLIRFTKPIDIT